MMKFLNILVILLIVSCGKTPFAEQSNKGQETTNGDWSLANKGRTIYIYSLRDLNTELKGIDYDSFLEEVESPEFRVWIEAQPDLLDMLTDFLTLFKIPENHDLIQAKLQSKYFAKVEENGQAYYEPQLDYFLKFGQNKLNFQTLAINDEGIRTFYSKLEILKLFLKEHDGKDHWAKDFSKALSRLELSSGSLKNLNELLKDQDDDSIHALSEIMDALLVRMRNEQIWQKSFSVEKEVGSDFTYTLEYGERKNYFHCSEDEDVDVANCQSETILSTQAPLILTYSKDDQIIKTIERGDYLYLSLKEHNVLSMSGFFDERSVFADLSFPLHSTLGMDIEWEQNYTTSKSILSKAKKELLEGLVNVDASKLGRMLRSGHRITYPNTHQTWLSEKILDLKGLSKDEFLQGKFNIKSMDYNFVKDRIFLTSSYYAMFNSYQSLMEERFYIRMVKKIILHEIMHLLSYSEEQSQEKSQQILEFLDSFDEPTLLQLNDAQMTRESMELLNKEHLNTYLKGLSIKLSEVLTAKGYVLKEKVTFEKIENVGMMCVFARVVSPCSKHLSSFDEIVRVSFVFEGIEGQRLEIQTNVEIGFTLENWRGHEGRLKISYSHLGNKVDLLDDFKSIDIIDLDKNIRVKSISKKEFPYHYDEYVLQTFLGDNAK